MNTSMIAVLLGLALATPALAQQAAPSATDHEAHHPQAVQMPDPSGAATARAQSGPAGAVAQGQMPMMSGGAMMGQRAPSQGGGMMGQSGCPMMQGGMMGGQGMGGMQMGAQGRGDQSVGTLALQAVNQRMHREMMFEYSGNVDVDFTRNMIAHHQGAIDMAKIVVAFGKDPKIRQLAESVVKEQEGEIATMKAWLAENAPKQ
jgi:uncharacterized protein (DUF305 family)